jgi:hypothetical protein
MLFYLMDEGSVTLKQRLYQWSVCERDLLWGIHGLYSSKTKK